MTVRITDSAAARFKTMIADSSVLPRVEIAAGGCNGFEKRFSMDTQQPGDMVIELSNGAAMLIDEMSYELLSNSVIDFKQGVTGSYFSIDVPEAASTCGCGTSFSL